MVLYFLYICQCIYFLCSTHPSHFSFSRKWAPCWRGRCSG